MEKLNSTLLEEQLLQEKNQVLTAHAKKERKRTFVIGICTAGVLMIPVIVCLICNLAIGHGLDWFFLVLASLLVFASLTVVPMIVPERTGLWTLGSFVGSLLLLLLVICLYTGGNWFFLAAVPTVFGLSVVFMPYVVSQVPLPKKLAHSKGLLVMLWDTLGLYAVIVVCGISLNSLNYWRISLEITTFCLLLPWGLFLIIRYMRTHPLIKTGLCVLIGGIFVSIINDVIGLILRDSSHFYILNANVSDWNDAFILLGLGLIAVGFVLQRREKH